MIRLQETTTTKTTVQTTTLRSIELSVATIPSLFAHTDISETFKGWAESFCEYLQSIQRLIEEEHKYKVLVNTWLTTKANDSTSPKKETAEALLASTNESIECLTATHRQLTENFQSLWSDHSLQKTAKRHHTGPDLKADSERQLATYNDTDKLTLARKNLSNIETLYHTFSKSYIKTLSIFDSIKKSHIIRSAYENVTLFSVRVVIKQYDENFRLAYSKIVRWLDEQFISQKRKQISKIEASLKPATGNTANAHPQLRRPAHVELLDASATAIFNHYTQKIQTLEGSIGRHNTEIEALKKELVVSTSQLTEMERQKKTINDKYDALLVSLDREIERLNTQNTQICVEGEPTNTEVNSNKPSNTPLQEAIDNLIRRFGLISAQKAKELKALQEKNDALNKAQQQASGMVQTEKQSSQRQITEAIAAHEKVAAQLNDELRILREQQRVDRGHFEATLTEKNVKLEQLTTQIDIQIRDHGHKINIMISQHATEKTALQNKANSALTQLQQQSERYNALQTAKSAQDAEVTKLTAALQAATQAEKKIATDYAALVAKQSAKEQSFATEAQALSEQHSKQIADLKAQHDTKRQALEKQLAAVRQEVTTQTTTQSELRDLKQAKDALTQKHATLLTAAAVKEREFVELTTRYAALFETNEQLQAAHSAALAKKESEIAELKLQIRKLTEQHTHAIERLTAEFNAQMSAKEKTNAEIHSALVKQHAELQRAHHDIQTKQTGLISEKQSLEANKLAQEREIDRLTTLHTQLSEVEKQLRIDHDTLKASEAAKVQKLTAEVERLTKVETTLTALQVTHNAGSTELREKYTAQIATLRREIDTANSKLTAEQAQFQHDLQAVRDDKDNISREHQSLTETYSAQALQVTQLTKQLDDLKQLHDRVTSAHSQALTAKTTEISELHAAAATLKSEYAAKNAALIASHESAIAALEKRTSAAYAELKSQHEQLQASFDSTNREKLALEAERAVLLSTKADQTQKLTTLTANLAAVTEAKERLERQNIQLSASESTTVQTLNARIQALTAQHTNDRTALVSGHSTKITALQTQASVAQAEHSRALEALKAKMTDIEQSKVQLTEERDRLITEKTAQAESLAKLTSRLDEITRANASLDEQHKLLIASKGSEVQSLQAKIQTLTTEHAAALVTQRAALEKRASEAQAEYKQQLETLTTKMATLSHAKEELTHERDGLIDAKTTQEKLVTRLKADLDNINRAKETLVAEHSRAILSKDRDIQSLNTKVETLTRQQELATTQFSSDRALLQAQFEQQKTALEQRINTDKKATEQQLAQIIADNSTLDAAKKELIIELNALRLTHSTETNEMNRIKAQLAEITAAKQVILEQHTQLVTSNKHETDELNSKLRTLSQQHAADKSILTAQHQTLMSSLQQKVDGEKANLNAAVTALKAELATANKAKDSIAKEYKEAKARLEAEIIQMSAKSKSDNPAELRSTILTLKNENARLALTSSRQLTKIDELQKQIGALADTNTFSPQKPKSGAASANIGSPGAMLHMMNLATQTANATAAAGTPTGSPKNGNSNF